MKKEKLKRKQERLANKIILKDSFKDFKYVGGCSFIFYKNKIIAAIVVVNKKMEIVERRSSICKEKFKYTPGFFAFSVLRSVKYAWKKLKIKPDVLIFNAHGILHPRKCGLASHFGIELGIPTIGVAKKLLCGKAKGNFIYLKGEKCGFKIGRLFVSQGHKISLRTSIKIVKKFLKDSLPEPIKLSKLYAREILRQKKFK